jgi:hypothetical protein
LLSALAWPFFLAVLTPLAIARAMLSMLGELVTVLAAID